MRISVTVPFIIATSGLLTSGAIAQWPGQWQGLCPNGHWVQSGPGYMCVQQQDIPQVYGPREYAPQGQASPSPINPYDNAITREFSRLGGGLMSVAPLPDNVPLSNNLVNVPPLVGYNPYGEPADPANPFNTPSHAEQSAPPAPPISSPPKNNTATTSTSPSRSPTQPGSILNSDTINNQFQLGPNNCKQVGVC